MLLQLIWRVLTVVTQPATLASAARAQSLHNALRFRVLRRALRTLDHARVVGCRGGLARDAVRYKARGKEACSGSVPPRVARRQNLALSWQVPRRRWLTVGSARIVLVIYNKRVGALFAAPVRLRELLRPRARPRRRADSLFRVVQAAADAAVDLQRTAVDEPRFLGVAKEGHELQGGSATHQARNDCSGRACAISSGSHTRPTGWKRDSASKPAQPRHVSPDS